MTWSI